MVAVGDSRQALIVFARAPALGGVKTRLAAELGASTALSIYRGVAERVISSVRVTTAHSVTIAYTPPHAESAMRAWLGMSVDLWPQPDLDLGARMASAIAGAIAGGAERVVVIGTDCPDVTTAVVDEAFDQLATTDVVCGPASDGGYYLIGMSRLHRALFENIPWSSPATLGTTRERARHAGLSVALLDERSDIDTADDWRAWLASRVHGDPSRTGVSPSGR